MKVSIEISYYPLIEDFTTPINSFIQKLANHDFAIEIGSMSTIITGEYNEIMQVLTNAIGDLIDKYPSVFNVKISNSCIVK